MITHLVSLYPVKIRSEKSRQLAREGRKLLLPTFQHRAGVRLYTSCYHLAESCVFNKQSLPPGMCRFPNQKIGEHPFSRSYGVILPSSFDVVLSSALCYCLSRRSRNPSRCFEAVSSTYPIRTSPYVVASVVVHESLSGVKEESGAIGLPESFPWHEREKNQRNTGLRANELEFNKPSFSPGSRRSKEIPTLIALKGDSPGTRKDRLAVVDAFHDVEASTQPTPPLEPAPVPQTDGSGHDGLLMALQRRSHVQGVPDVHQVVPTEAVR
ncbi:UNVERIFIED_CONTAM: hypothetical protein Scaly_1007100 [Sesamum calycinum]|uniref:Uncharacterized protein n=1 Tax=Sesamum calycinum TaxID=2727403 RepID=A0AAW2QZW7_9LAMI